MNQSTYQDLKGRHVLVIGHNETAIAIQAGLRQNGAHVIESPRSKPVEDLKEIDLESIALQVRNWIDQHQYIDIMIHADELFDRASALDMDVSRWKDIVQYNILSKYRFAKEVGKQMLHRGIGNIILMSSIAGIVATPGAIAYSASQGAIHQITRTLAVEWAERGVRVNAIASTYPSGVIPESRIQQVAPMKRIPTIEELMGTVLYLSSSASQMVTGQILSVDGGYITQ